MSDYDIWLDADGLPAHPEHLEGVRELSGHSMTAPMNPMVGMIL